MRSTLRMLSTGVSSSSPVGLRRVDWPNAVLPTPQKSLSFSLQPTLKLPVWPVWGGVLAQLADWVGAKALSSAIMQHVGGRVVPISLSESSLSPFILLVHHKHSFTSLDPFRPISKLLLPEGFPAHPHAGFDTVTYCVEGGMRHRDSESFRMDYGNGDVQWMRAGRGVIHEEMWDIPAQFGHHKLELFQIWVNLPRREKSATAFTRLLAKDDIPTITLDSTDSARNQCGRIKIISGQFVDTVFGKETIVQGPGCEIAATGVGIYHMILPPHMKVSLEATNISSGLLFAQSGSGFLHDISNNSVIGPQDLAVFHSNTMHSGFINLSAGEKGLSVLILIGQDLKEPVLARGSFVQCDEQDMNKVQTIFSSLGDKAFWDYRLSDDDWKAHSAKLQLQKVITYFQTMFKDNK
eukprot:gene7069-7819_t